MNRENNIEKQKEGEEIIKNKIEKGEIGVERVLDESVVDKLMEVQEKALPEGEDPLADRIKKEEFVELIQDPKVVLSVLKKEGEIVGYAFARPIRDAVQDILKYDPKILETDLSDKDDEKKYYFDTVVLMKEHRDLGSSIALYREMVEEMKAMRVKKVTFHIREKRGKFSLLIKEFTKKETLIHKIQNFLNSGITIDYLEYEI